MNIKPLTLAEKIGQLCMIGVDGESLQPETVNILTNFHIGNVVIRSKNVKSPKQLHQLTQSLQSYAQNTAMLIAMQQGGGKQNSLKQGLTTNPNQQTLGKINNPLYTRQIAQVVGEELRNVGVNMNLLPSLNLSTDEETSFGDNIKDTTRHGVATIQGYHKANIITAIQDFPGSGDLQANINASLLHIGPFRKTALQPFIKAIAADAQIISISNELTALKKSTVPAVLSDLIVQKLLREKLGYEGVIMTDSLQAEQIKNHCPVEEAAVRAIEAGVDLLLIPEKEAEQMAVVEAIKKAVITGRISESRINASVERILQLKQTFDADELVDFDRDQFRKQWSQKLEARLEEKTMEASN